jgi:hypothetical protein
MSTHVHREGAHKIVVQDETGREVTLTSQDHTLEVSTTGAGPRLTPQMAQDLADELHQWATCQQTVRRQGQRRAAPSDVEATTDEEPFDTPARRQPAPKQTNPVTPAVVPASASERAGPRPASSPS